MDYFAHFSKDKTCAAALAAPPPRDLLEGQIAGCSAIELHRNADARGNLVELLTSREGPIVPIVHVYQVFAEPGSLRAWIYHAVQTDRLCFTQGTFRVVLIDIRESSDTFQKRADFIFGADCPVRLTIPPFVVHGVHNIGDRGASYLNLPDSVYDLRDPDKYRVPADSPLFDVKWD